MSTTTKKPKKRDFLSSLEKMDTEAVMGVGVPSSPKNSRAQHSVGGVQGHHLKEGKKKQREGLIDKDVSTRKM